MGLGKNTNQLNQSAKYVGIANLGKACKATIVWSGRIHKVDWSLIE